MNHRTPSTPICDSDECLLFGIQREQYISYFNNFALDNTPDVEVSSSDAHTLYYRKLNFVYVGITFKKSNYVAHAELKQIGRENKSNLLYEYRVGTFLNYFCSILPSFVYTYGIYEGPQFKLGYPIDLKSFKQFFGQRMKDTCKSEANLSLLSQYVTNKDKLNSNSYSIKRQGSIYEIMFQIYYTLACMQKFNFKHNNLPDNIYLVRFPVPILFQYKLANGKTFEFACHYIVKIMDYSQCTYENTDQDLAEFQTSCGVEKEMVQPTRDTYLFEQLMEPADYLHYFMGDRSAKDPSLNDLLEFLMENIKIVQDLDRPVKHPTPLGTLIVDGYNQQNMKIIRS